MDCLILFDLVEDRSILLYSNTILYYYTLKVNVWNIYIVIIGIVYLLNNLYRKIKN